MHEKLELLDRRMESIEGSMQRMENAVTAGMSQIGNAMDAVAHVMAHFQENAEEHRRLHGRIDSVHEMAERLDKIQGQFEVQYSSCCGNPKIVPKDPVLTALTISAYTVFGLSYIFLVLYHSKDMLNVIFK